VFDMPQQPYERYVRQRVSCNLSLWAPHCQLRQICAGNRLRIQTPADVSVRWAVGDAGLVEAEHRDTSIGAWLTDLDTTVLPAGSRIRFALVPKGASSWGELHEVEVVA
jgi:hypothetical protein